MNELCPKNGFIQFLFSNQKDDRYYIPQCVAFRFPQYLFYALGKYHYHYIYFLEESRLLSGNELSDREWNKTNNDGFFANLLKLKNAPTEDNQKQLEQWSPKYQTVDCRTAARKILDMMQTVSHTAMIVPLAVFRILSEDKKLAWEMKKINNQNRRDALLIVSCPIDADAMMPYFSPNVLQDDEKDFSTENGILGADIYAVSLKNMIDEETAYSFFFDELKSKLHERVVFWNTLDYSQILGMTRRYFMNEIAVTDPRFGELEWYASVLWVWYHFSVFRYLSRVQLKDNPYRKMSVVEQNLKSPKIFDEMTELIHCLQEIYTSPERFLSEWELETIQQQPIFLYSQKTNNDIRKVNQIIERCCTDQTIMGIRDFALMESLEPLMKIEQMAARFAVAQNKDYNAEKLFYELIEQTKKILDHAKKAVTKRLVRDGKMIEALYLAISAYYQYIDNYSAMESDSSDNSFRFQKKGKLYELMLELARQIAEDNAQIEKILDNFNNTDNEYETELMRDQYNAFSKDKDKAELYYERAKDCAEDLENIIGGITSADSLTSEICDFLNVKY